MAAAGPAGASSPTPRDAHPTGRSPPVGGRLLGRTTQWARLDPGRWVLGVVASGYKVEFTAPPPTYDLPNVTPVPGDPGRRLALEEELQALLSKHAVEPVPANQALPLFRSRFFLAPKKQNQWRPILNLRPLNRRFVRPKGFRMETLHNIIPLLTPGMWATTVDLQDAYLHIPIDPDDRRFLAFHYRGVDYQFRTLPFGLSTAPRVFTRMTRPILAFLRRRGIKLYAYLDDWLVVAESERLVGDHTREVLSLLQDLGWVVNVPKSSLIPTQRITYLGASLDLRNGYAYPTPERLCSVTQLAGSILLEPFSTAREWMRLLGLMASLVDLLDLCRLRMRPLQGFLLSSYKPSLDPQSTPIELPEGLKPFLSWWTVPLNVAQGRPFRQIKPRATITTDASTTGWGATWGHRQVSGNWSAEDRQCHINTLETEAVCQAVRHWAIPLRGHCVTVRSDNTTTVAYINREGGTKSRSLLTRTWDLLLLCDRLQIKLQATHLAGKLNTTADALSRLDDKEWTLNQPWANHLFQVYDRPTVDLFATETNTRLPSFCTRRFSPKAWGMDAFSFPWTNLYAYAFPPWCMIHRVLTTLRDSNATLLLVAPCWPAQPWFPLLIEMLVDLPLQLPAADRILTQKGGQVRYHSPDQLHLSAWKLSGAASAQRDFQHRLLNLQQLPVGTPRLLLTTIAWRSSAAGQSRTLSVPWMRR